MATTRRAEFIMGIRHKKSGRIIHVSESIAPILDGETREQAVASMLAEWEIVASDQLETITETTPMDAAALAALERGLHKE